MKARAGSLEETHAKEERINHKLEQRKQNLENIITSKRIPFSPIQAKPFASQINGLDPERKEEDITIKRNEESGVESGTKRCSVSVGGRWGPPPAERGGPPMPNG